MHYVIGDGIFNSETGKEIIWRGAGGSYLFHAGDRYQEAWQLHLPEIKTMGLNTVRLAFAFADSSPNPEYGTPSADILDFTKLDWILNFLSMNGIKAILDCHNYRDMAGDFGSQKLINDWLTVAQRYRGDSRIVAYELFNEPGATTWAPTVTSKIEVARAYAELTDVVRQVDPDHIVIWESDYYLPIHLQDVAGYFRPNMVFTVHRWWWSNNPLYQMYSVEQLSYMAVGYLVENRKQLNIPFWLGEFGSGYPFGASNPEWLLSEQILWRCEEQVFGWNLWMGRTAINKPWSDYLPFFPLKVYNPGLVRRGWFPPTPSFEGYILDSKGVDVMNPYRIAMWHNNDYVTFKPGIIIRVITTHKLPDGTFEIVTDEKITVTSILTVRNEEGTSTHPGDWNITIYPVSYIPNANPALLLFFAFLFLGTL